MPRVFLYFSKRIILSLLLVIEFSRVHGQDVINIKGVILDKDQQPLTGVTISSPQLKSTVFTDEEGVFEFNNVSPGVYTLKASYVGYKVITKSITVKDSNISQIVFILEDDGKQLSEVMVIGKSETRRVKEQPIKAEVINTKEFQDQPSSLIEIMNRSAGIRIRQSGGLGSESNLMVNGFQGRSIRYFKDGIPLDYLGAGFNIAIVPANMLERLEVYKGVLPTSLGADAVGGAVNLISKKYLNSSLEASYEIGSFNTHRVSLNGYSKPSAKGFFGGFNAFYNYSDNNYNVDVKVTDPELGTLKDARIRLFHNKFENYYVELYGGIKDKKWADELKIGLTAFGIERDNQFGSRMTNPFGEATSRQYSFIPTLNYKKQFWEKLNFEQFLVANTLFVNQTDTAARIYDWYGNYTETDAFRGEISTRGSLAELKYSYYTSRSNFAYELSSKNTLNLNVVFSGFNRIGEDPLGATFIDSGEDVLKAKAKYNKTILALGLESQLIEDRLTSNTIVKYFAYSTNATDADYNGNAISNQNTDSRFGFAEALKLTLNDNSFLRASAETALRLPEQDELFGDGNLKLSNFALKPEKSFNANLGYVLEKRQKYSLELNSFYRKTKDLILNVPHNFLYSQSQNVRQVKGYGFEADFKTHLNYWLKANANFTYQSIRLFGMDNPTLEGSRLRNTPYFFANAGFNTLFNKVLSRKDKIDIYLFYQFVKAYYLDNIPKDKEPTGFLGLWGKPQIDARNVIPDQNIVSTGFTYTPSINGVSLGFQVKNIFDTPVYDNFRIQNIGRSFHFKINYIIK